MVLNTAHHELPLPTFDSPVRLLAVVAPYYRAIADGLLAGARARAAEAGAVIDMIEVPGALEVPAAIALGHETGRFDAYVALGVVIRGETYHFEVVSNESARGIMALTLDGLAIGNGILTVENEEQALARADKTRKDKGGEAAKAALAMLALKEQFGVA